MMIKRKARRSRPKEVSDKKLQIFKQKGFGTEMPPEFALVEIYFDQKEAAAQVASFYRYYQQMNWTGRRGAPYRNWKVLAADWIYNHRQELHL